MTSAALLTGMVQGTTLLLIERPGRQLDYGILIRTRR
jgi:hypothetical protein